MPECGLTTKEIADTIEKYNGEHPEYHNDFVPLEPETEQHDMLIGPCKCGAWHNRVDWI